MKDNIKVLFLILNYKTYQETVRLTDELISEPPDDKMVLIVDNDSPNESYDVLSERYQQSDLVEVIQAPENGGYAKGNNFGLRYAKKYNPEFVCIINNDVHFTMQTIDNLVDKYSKIPPPPTAFIAPRQILPSGKEASFTVMDVPTIWSDLLIYSPLPLPRHQYIESKEIKGVSEIGIIPGAFIFTSYARFESLGFFDESTFLYCEERFIAKKAQLAGMKSYIITDETYVHDHSVTISSEATQRKQRQWMLDGRIKYHRKYSSHPKLSVAALKIAYHVGECAIKIKKMLKP